MFYLTTHSTHFIYGYMVNLSRKNYLLMTLALGPTSRYIRLCARVIRIRCISNVCSRLHQCSIVHKAHQEQGPMQPFRGEGDVEGPNEARSLGALPWVTTALGFANVLRSGQVRSECLTCTFRASCCSARLSRAQVPAFADSSVRDRGKKGGRELGGTACTGGYKGVRAVRPESVAGGGQTFSAVSH